MLKNKKAHCVFCFFDILIDHIQNKTLAMTLGIGLFRVFFESDWPDFQPKKNQMFPCDRQMLQAWDRQGILWFLMVFDALKCLSHGHLT